MLKVSFSDRAMFVIRACVRPSHLPCHRDRGHIFWSVVTEIGVDVIMKSRSSSKMGHSGSKSRSLRLKIEKPCHRNRGHIFYSIIMKIVVYMYLDDF